MYDHKFWAKPTQAKRPDVRFAVHRRAGDAPADVRINAAAGLSDLRLLRLCLVRLVEDQASPVEAA